jgi:hypothetical protein
MGFFSWKTQDTCESIFNIFAEEDWGARRFPGRNDGQRRKPMG